MVQWEQETFQGLIGKTIADSKPWWKEADKPRDGAPNVVVVLLDDLGFAQLGCYGSDIATPNIDALANDGLRYNNFHTTALCSPTRAALLTGRHPHAVGLRSVLSQDGGFPNARGRVSKEAALISEVLVDHGYNTFAVGKWHLNLDKEQSFAGPFDNWPLGRGFEHYYGFLGGATSQWNPTLVEDNRRVPLPAEKGKAYHLTEDITDKFISYIREQKTASPEKPFFGYVAYGATHAPHHAPPAYIDNYKGRFDQGWDALREQTYKRQQELGIIPKNAELPPRSPDVRAWDSLSVEEKKLYTRLQEAFAGFLEHTDEHIGRIIHYLSDIGELDRTLFILLSDNGACAAGGEHGSLNHWADFAGQESYEQKLARYDEIGTPLANNHYPKGWAQAGNTPLRWYKSFVHAGGIKDPLIIHYPEGIDDIGGIRNQYHHVIDIVPTILEIIGIEGPLSYKGVQQLPIHGVSLAYSFDQASAPTAKQTQVYEMVGNRAVYHEGWKAVAIHKADTDFDVDRWELYHVEQDYSELNDLSTQYPEKLEELKALWWSEAEKVGILPIEERSFHRVLAESRLAQASATPTVRVFYRSEQGLPISKAPDVRDKSFEIEADLLRGSIKEEGVIIAAGARAAGYSLYIQGNRLYFANNLKGTSVQIIASEQELPVGALKIIFRYVKTGDGEGLGILLINDKEAGQGQLTGTAQLGFSFGLFNIGRNDTTPIVPFYEAPFRFAGEIEKVVYRVSTPELDAASAEVLELASE